MAGGIRAPSVKAGGRRRHIRHVPMSEINVTPLVDVMLVLLIVFMIAAPLLTVGVPVDLPQAQSKPLQGDQEPLTVTVDGAGKIFLQETPVELDQLVPRLIAIAANGYDQRVFVRGDRNVNYGTVMQVMAQMSEAGFTRIGLVNESPGADKRKPAPQK
jgi:biopolymer transport protein TolR